MQDQNLIGPESVDEQQQIVDEFRGEKLIHQDPISLEINDDQLVKILDQRISASEKFYDDQYNLTERRKKNKVYLFGRQIEQKERDKQLKEYEARFNDNVLYEIESSLKPLAMSHLPDMMVLPGSEDPQKQESAKNLSIVVNDYNKKRSQRQVLALGFKHLPVYFTAIIKARWDKDMGKYGDYRFDIVHPKYILADHNAKTTNVDDMSFIREILPITVQELFMRFPKKKDDLIKELKKNGVQLSDDPSWKELATVVEVDEVWFTWYKEKKTGKAVDSTNLDQYKEDNNYERIDGVMWKYKNILLDKMLDPNYDHEGESVPVIADPNNPDAKTQVEPQQLMGMMLTGNMQGLSVDKVFRNYFERCHKPYFFFSYDQWGEIPYDETSRIEQNMRNQENLDEQGKRMIDKLKQRVKHIWSKDSGLKSEDIQKMDMENPNLDALVEGKLTEVHTSITPERPDAAEFKAVTDTRDRMYAVAGANAIRGDLQSDVATSNQIAREADFTRADDLVEETINAASEWMANWQMQFIKLRYSQEHLTQILGSKGQITFIKLRRDMISDGMEVIIKASSTDKLKAQKNAMQLAQLGPQSGVFDPLSFFEDMDMSDPEGRTERALLFATDPAGYMAKFVLKLQNTDQMVGALNGMPPQAQPPAPAGPPNPMQPNQAMAQPQNPSPMDTSNVPAQPPTAPQASPRAVA